MYTAYIAYGNHCVYQRLDSQDSSRVPHDEVLRLSLRFSFHNFISVPDAACTTLKQIGSKTIRVVLTSPTEPLPPSHLMGKELREVKHRHFFFLRPKF